MVLLSVSYLLCQRDNILEAGRLYLNLDHWGSELGSDWSGAASGRQCTVDWAFCYVSLVLSSVRGAQPPQAWRRSSEKDKIYYTALTLKYRIVKNMKIGWGLKVTGKQAEVVNGVYLKDSFKW